MAFQSQQLKNLKLNDVVSNTSQISAYVNDNFMRLDGGAVNGSIAVNNADPVTDLPGAIATGNGSFAVGSEFYNLQNARYVSVQELNSIKTKSEVQPDTEYVLSDDGCIFSNVLGTLSAEENTWVRRSTRNGLFWEIANSPEQIAQYKLCIDISVSELNTTAVLSASQEIGYRLKDSGILSTYLYGYAGMSMYPTYDETGENIVKWSIMRARSIAKGDGSAAFGTGIAIGENSVAEGGAHAVAYQSHAEGGVNTRSYGTYSHAEGNGGITIGICSHAEGSDTSAIGDSSHAEGDRSVAIGVRSHAEGCSVSALEYCSHAEGYLTKATGAYAHAEGVYSTAKGRFSHAEGYDCLAYGDYSHAEGHHTSAFGDGSHADGQYTEVRGNYSYVGGLRSKVHSNRSFAIGENNLVSGYGQDVFGNGVSAYLDNSFIWSPTGIRISADPEKFNRRNYSFNVNPYGGINGFYVGNQSLSTILNTAISANSEELSTYVSAAVSNINKKIKNFNSNEILDENNTDEYILCAFIQPNGKFGTWNKGGDITNKISVESDDILLIRGNATDQYTRAAGFYDIEDNAISTMSWNLQQNSTPAIVYAKDVLPNGGYVRSAYAYNTNIENTYILKTKDKSQTVSIIDGAYLTKTYTPEIDANSHYTLPIAFDKNTIFKISLAQQYVSPIVWIILDERKKPVKSEQLPKFANRTTVDTKIQLNDYIVYGADLLRENPFGKYIVFSSYRSSLKIDIVNADGNVENAKFVVSQNVLANDYLYGKKWIACGDSYTKADWSDYTDEKGNIGMRSNAFDTKYQLYKTYPVIIAANHDMNLVLSAAGGMKMYDQENPNGTFAAKISSLSAEISSADYFTLQFGLNDGISSIGAKEDSEPTSMWGAYNSTLSSVLTWNPGIKIGVIISDGWLRKEYHDALIDICKWWGIPYIDLLAGDNVSLQYLKAGTAIEWIGRNPFAV